MGKTLILHEIRRSRRLFGGKTQDLLGGEATVTQCGLDGQSAEVEGRSK